MTHFRLLGITTGLLVCANLWGCSGQQADNQGQPPAQDGVAQPKPGTPKPDKLKQDTPKQELSAGLLVKCPEARAAWLIDKFNGVIDKIEVDQVRGSLTPNKDDKGNPTLHLFLKSPQLSDDILGHLVGFADLTSMNIADTKV